MVTIVLVASTKDTASLNMYECVKPQFGLSDLTFEDTHICEGKIGANQIYLVLIETQSVDANNIDVELKNTLGSIDVVIFLSKHASVSEIPSFCIHTQGNWGSADLGGSPKTLGVTPAVLKNLLYANMYAKNPTSFDVVQEATHHGPDLETPAIFYEIGSTPAQWEDTQLGEFMVETLLCTLEEYAGEESDLSCFFCIGGSHTCSNYNRLSFEKKALLAHIVPNYALDSLDETMVKQALAKSTLKSDIVVDWKSLNSTQREFVANLLDYCELSFEKLKKVKSRLDS